MTVDWIAAQRKAGQTGRWAVTTLEELPIFMSSFSCPAARPSPNRSLAHR
jgi:hypothetical protein